MFPDLPNIASNREDLGVVLRHILVEGYVAQATPGWVANSDRGPAPAGDVSRHKTPGVNLDAPHAFIYRTLIAPNAPTPNVPAGSRGRAVDYFLRSRAEYQRSLDAIKGTADPIAHPVDYFFLVPYYTGLIERIDRGLQNWSRLGLAISRALFDPQARRNTENDRCVKEVQPEADSVDPTTARSRCEDKIGIVKVIFHEVNPDDDDTTASKPGFVFTYLIPMFGYIADLLGSLVEALLAIGGFLVDSAANALDLVLRPLGIKVNPIRDGVAKFKELALDFVKLMVYWGTGISVEDLEAFLEHPTAWLDVQQVTLHEMKLPTSLGSSAILREQTIRLFTREAHARIDALMGLPPDHHVVDADPVEVGGAVTMNNGASGPNRRLADSAKFDPEKFAPLYNTVVLAKRLLLDGDELNRALGDVLVDQGLIAEPSVVRTYRTGVDANGAPANIMIDALPEVAPGVGARTATRTAGPAATPARAAASPPRVPVAATRLAGDAAANATELVDVTPMGAPADSGADDPVAISRDGRYVAFVSQTYGDLEPGYSSPAGGDVWVRDRVARTTERVSRGLNGQAPNGSSSNMKLSADGRYVVYYSEASNLVPGDVNRLGDVFLYDRATRTTELISVATSGAQQNGEPNTFSSSEPVAAVSADGRYVAFASRATNLGAAHPDANSNVWMRDRVARTTTLVSTNPNYKGPSEALSNQPAMSDDGRFVVFSTGGGSRLSPESDADSPLVDHRGPLSSEIYVRDVGAGTTELVSVLAPNARWVSTSSQEAPGISADGRYVVWQTRNYDIVPALATQGLDDQVFLRDLLTKRTEVVSLSTTGVPQNHYTFMNYGPSVSADGRYVAWTSLATNLVPGAGTADGSHLVYLRDRQTKMTEVVSLDPGGKPPLRGGSDGAMLSADGRYVAFSSTSALTTGTGEGCCHAYVRDRGPVGGSDAPDLPQSWLQSIDSDHAWRQDGLPRFCDRDASADICRTAARRGVEDSETNGGTGRFPLWESCLLRPAFRALFRDWEADEERAWLSARNEQDQNLGHFPDMLDGVAFDASVTRPPASTLTVTPAPAQRKIGRNTVFGLSATGSVFAAGKVAYQYRFYDQPSNAGPWQSSANGAPFALPSNAREGSLYLDYRTGDPCHPLLGDGAPAAAGMAAEPTQTAVFILDGAGGTTPVIPPGERKRLYIPIVGRGAPLGVAGAARGR